MFNIKLWIFGSKKLEGKLNLSFALQVRVNIKVLGQRPLSSQSSSSKFLLFRKTRIRCSQVSIVYWSVHIVFWLTKFAIDFWHERDVRSSVWWHWFCWRWGDLTFLSWLSQVCRMFFATILAPSISTTEPIPQIAQLPIPAVDQVEVNGHQGAEDQHDHKR